MAKPKIRKNPIKVFIGEVQAELEKSTWPSNDELLGSTIVVIVSVIIFSLFIALSDWILTNVMGWIL